MASQNLDATLEFDPDADKPANGEALSKDDIAAVDNLRQAHKAIREQMSRAVVGQDEVIDQILIAIFAKGHALLVGVPGLAKTLMIRTLADALSLSFNRIQFTPDLMPADITGTEILEEGGSTMRELRRLAALMATIADKPQLGPKVEGWDKAEDVATERALKFLSGPVFANVILADEINRTPPKTQAALLEAMQEYQVTAGGRRHMLPQPFFVLATQNPIEQEGTYPLPEAQQDRFMFNIKVDYPNLQEELDIIRMTTATYKPQLDKVLAGEEIMRLQDVVRRVPVADSVIHYAMSLVRKTRLNQPETPDFINEWVAWGAGPRACQYLILGGKARAILDGRHFVSKADIQSVAHPVLRHRIICNFSAEAEGITSDKVIDKLLETTDPNYSETLDDRKLPAVTG